MITETTPAYIVARGGCYLTVDVPVSNVTVCVSAVKPDTGSEWTVFKGDTRIIMSARYTERQMREVLLTLAREALTDVLALIVAEQSK